MAPPKEGARRRQSWTKRLDENGLPGKMGYFTGTEWATLEAGAVAAGCTTIKTVKGQKVEVPNVTAYVMTLHRTSQGATSQ